MNGRFLETRLNFRHNNSNKEWNLLTRFSVLIHFANGREVTLLVASTAQYMM